MPSDTYILTIADAGVSTPADGSVTTIKIADSSSTTTGVTTAKIANLNVTTAKIADDAVTTAKILTLNVTTDKIAAGAVTDVKLATNAVTTVKITDLNVTTDKLAVAAVTNDKLAVITGAGKIANSATTATDANTASAIVARDGNGNFTAGTVTAALTGNAATATTAAACTGNAATATTAAACTGNAATATTAAACTGNAATATTAAACTGNAATATTAAACTGNATTATTATNLAVGTTGAIPYQTAAGATGFISAVATGNVLLSNGLTTVPQYGKVILTTGSTQHVTGTLPVANGGTGQTLAVRGQISKMTAFTAVTVSATTIYYPLTNEGTLDTTVSTNMTLGATSTFSIKNTSGVTRVFRIYASVDAVASNDDILGIMLYAGVAGSLSARVETECRAFTSAANDPAKLVTSWMISLANNEEVAVYVANHSAIQNITAQRARLIAEAII